MLPHLQKKKILNLILAKVCDTGWSKESIQVAAEQSKFSFDEVMTAFDNDIGEIVKFFNRCVDEEMVSGLRRGVKKKHSIRGQIKKAILLRLRILSRNKKAFKNTMAYLSFPQNLTLSLDLLYSTADSIWRSIGDKSTDFNFYTKRILLSGIYLPTLLFWIEDRSDGFRDTSAFIDRRIENIMHIQKLRGALKDKFEGVGGEFVRGFTKH